MKRYTILVAGADFAVAEVIIHILRREGYYVGHITSSEGILTIKENLPDLFLVDIKTKSMDGEKICREMRQDRRFDNIRMMLLSTDPEIAVRAAAAQADDYLAMPFEMDELIYKVRATLFNTK